jgi:uncharacterized damage-inducible protein DinB
MSGPVLVEGIQRQFAEAYDVLEAAMVQFTPAQWAQGGSPYNGPARAVIHALQCAEFYTNKDDSVWGRFGTPVWEMTDDDLPTVETMSEYLTQVRRLTADWIDGNAGHGLTEPAGYGQSRLEAMLYALRHLEHHTGEVCAYLKQAGHDQSQWT